MSNTTRVSVTPVDSQSSIQFKRRQFPLCFAFYMTIYKSQGQTLDCMGLFLPETVFSHGQFYVALSRVKSPSAIKIIAPSCASNNSNSSSHNNRNNSNNANSNNIYTDNVVYSELF